MHSLRRIIAIPNKLSELTNELSELMNELSELTNELSELMNELSELTNELSEFTNELFEFTNELSELTNELFEFTNELSELTNELFEFTNELFEFTNELSELVQRLWQRRVVLESGQRGLESPCHRQVREKRLRRPALAAEEVQRIAPLPRIGGVADGAEGVPLGKGPFAVIAGDRLTGRVHVIFATDFTATRTTPANSHRVRPLSKKMDDWMALRIADEKE